MKQLQILISMLRDTGLQVSRMWSETIPEYNFTLQYLRIQSATKTIGAIAQIWEEGNGFTLYLEDTSVNSIEACKDEIIKMLQPRTNFVIQAVEAENIAEMGRATYPDTEADGIVFCGKCGKMR